VNFEGAEAFALDEKMELYSAVVTTALSDKFYESTPQRIERVRSLIKQNDPEFVARLAIYARTKMHLRSVPLVVVVELAKTQSGNPLVKKAVRGVVLRADEITELLAYYQLANAREGVKKLNKLSKQIQRGLGEAFNNFDEYQFAKYNRAGQVKLKDALFLVHPKPANEEQQMVFNKIAKDDLMTPYTWETELSALGQLKFISAEEKASAFRAKWEELVGSGRLGYMALLRNLRNIIEAGVSLETMKIVCSRLADREGVAKSKQLPFRFLAAYREVKVVVSGFVPMVLDALEEAVMHSARNIRGFSDTSAVVIACDVSGSMQKPVSDRSKIMNYDLGLMLAMLLQSRCQNVRTGMFGDTWKVIHVSHHHILANVQEFYNREGEVGYSTNGYLVIQDLIRKRTVVDKVMIFTDCQLWNSSSGNVNDSACISVLWKRYREFAPEARLYLFDLNGYGHTPVDVRSDGVFLVAGWSDKIFDVLAAIEEGRDTLSEIDRIEL